MPFYSEFIHQYGSLLQAKPNPLVNLSQPQAQQLTKKATKSLKQDPRLAADTELITCLAITSVVHPAVIQSFIRSTVKPDQAWPLLRSIAETLLIHSHNKTCLRLIKPFIKTYKNTAYLHHMIAEAYRQLGRAEQAIKFYINALKLNSDSIESHIGHIAALTDMGSFAAAYQQYLKAVTRFGDNPRLIKTQLIINLYDNTLESRLADDELRQLYADPQIHPELKWLCAATLCKRGHISEGIKKLVVRKQAFPAKYSLKPSGLQWQGEALNQRRLLIISEQGFGDNIQFARYIKLIKEEYPDAATNLLLTNHQQLTTLLEVYPWLDQIINQANLSGLEYDYFCNIQDLACYCIEQSQATLADYAHGYLDHAYTLTPEIPMLSEMTKVGFIFAGSTSHVGNHYRNIDPSYFAQLISERKDTQFYSLQLAYHTQTEWLAQQHLPNYTDLGPYIHDFADTAAIVQQLDYVITVDTALAHLAGALNKPTFLLLPLHTDWRWGFAGSQCHWYQSVELIRLSEYGSWDAVFAKLKHPRSPSTCTELVEVCRGD